MNRPSIWTLLSLSFLVLVVGCNRDAEDTAATGMAEAAPDAGFPVAAELFQARCQPCHGSDAMGGGTVSEFLTEPASDLTWLVDKYGAFPEELVSMTIDGRAEIESHGPREMPVWGNIWSDDADDSVAEDRAQERIRQLVEYIRSIQSAAATPAN